MKHAIIPIFIPHQGCPHQCVFCNQQKITGVTTTVTAQNVRSALAEALRVKHAAAPEVAFYGGSFTALPEAIQQELLSPAYEQVVQGNVRSIRISTRPDCINDKMVRQLKSQGVATIELGAQSLDDDVLMEAERGHTYRHIVEAVEIIQRAGLICGLQLMIGLPGEDWPRLIRSAQRALALKPDFFRLYPTLVISGTPLARRLKQNVYTPLTLEQATIRCAYLKLLFEYRHRLPVIRTGLQASECLHQPGTILAGPYHPSFGEMVDAHLFYLMLAKVIEESGARRLTVHYHPSDHSKLRGLCNQNLVRLNAAYPLQSLVLIPDGLAKSKLEIITEYGKHSINSQMLTVI